MEKINNGFIENKKVKYGKNKKSMFGTFLASILKISLAAALSLMLIAVIVNAGDTTVETGSIFTEKNNELFLSLKNTEAGGHDYRLVSAGSLGGIGTGKFGIYDATAGLTRLTIDSDGDVGIGTTNPVSRLDVSSIDGFNTITVRNPGVGDAGINFIEAGVNRGTLQWQPGANMLLEAGTGVGVKIRTGGADRLAVTSGGDVGIGTTSPSTYSSNSVVAISGTDTDLVLVGGTAGSGSIKFTDTADTTNQGWILYNHATDSFAFYTNTAERMRITSAGNVGIGTAAPRVGAKLDVVGGAITTSTQSAGISAPAGVWTTIDTHNDYLTGMAMVTVMDASNSPKMRTYLLMIVGAFHGNQVTVIGDAAALPTAPTASFQIIGSMNGPWQLQINPSITATVRLAKILTQ